jgi:glycosyltransferase involved in cell wall biosynthesis
MAEAGNEVTEEQRIEKVIRPVLFASNLTLSEYSLYLQRMLTGLADESIHAAIVCTDESAAQSIISPSVTIIRYPEIKLPFLKTENKRILIDKLGKFKPTVLHCLSESWISIVRQVSRQLNLPYFISVNGNTKQLRHLSQAANRLAGIITPSESLAAEAARVFPRLEERIELIKMGTFVPDTTSSYNKLRRSAVIGAACSVRDKTDFSKPLSAIKKLINEGYNFMMVIVGDGADEKALRSVVSSLGITKNITIIPRSEPWGAVFSACDIFIEPRQNKFFNLMLLEAMSAGAAIAGCKGGIDDLIISGQTAAVFDKNDESNIYSSIRHFLDYPQAAREIAVSAQNYVRNNHTVSKMVAETIECYANAQAKFNQR